MSAMDATCRAGVVAREAGFTFAELLVTLSVLALLAALAVPAFHSMLEKQRVYDAATNLFHDLSRARSAAVRAGKTVALCKSTDGASCIGSGGEWSGGWIVFEDDNDNLAHNSGEKILRVQQNTAGDAKTYSTRDAAVHFKSTGTSATGNATWQFCAPGDTGSIYTVGLYQSGRARLIQDESKTCTE